MRTAAGRGGPGGEGVPEPPRERAAGGSALEGRGEGAGVRAWGLLACLLACLPACPPSEPGGNEMGIRVNSEKSLIINYHETSSSSRDARSAMASLGSPIILQFKGG